MSQLPPKILLQQHQLFTEFKGAFTENFIAQELMASNFDKLYYWSSQGQAEVDFLLPYELNIFPLEVKAGIATAKKSLLVYGAKYNPQILSRTTLLNLKRDGNICNYPLYLVSLFPLATE